MCKRWFGKLTFTDVQHHFVMHFTFSYVRQTIYIYIYIYMCVVKFRNRVLQELLVLKFPESCNHGWWLLDWLITHNWLSMYACFAGYQSNWKTKNNNNTKFYTLKVYHLKMLHEILYEDRRNSLCTEINKRIQKHSILCAEIPLNAL